MKQPAVYLLASQRNGTLYVGVTSDLIKRVWQHRTHAVEGFTEKNNVNLLVWFEQHETMESAIAREKAIKKWNRAWKLALIEKTNPNWIDLWPVIIGELPDFRHPLDFRLRGNDESGVRDRDPQTPVIPSTPVIPAKAGASPTVIPAQAGIQKGDNA
ncbi:GIY-YIG nuclease family protein [Sulfuriferula sp.]|uniref:GIY-YIG nuclease family protein n=1 Tax=Sulfuriferula sp. TaxID=2025307 RepID=UPI003522E68A